MTVKRKSATRQRAQLSCDHCRRYKRKCDRTCPCKECQFRGKECSFNRATETAHHPQGRDLNAAATSSSPIQVQSISSVDEQISITPSDAIAAPSSSFTSLWDSPPDNASNIITSSKPPTSAEPDLERRLESFVCSPNALHHIIAAWRREDDWYHEIILDSPFMTAIMQYQTPPLSVVRRYAGVIYSIIAIVAQGHPSELEAILIRLSSTSTVSLFSSAGDIGISAEQTAKQWLDEIIHNSDASSWQAEVFQTSFLLMKLNKFLGRWTEYRQSLSLDFGRLQLANYHRLSSIMRDKQSSYQEISTRHRIFWHYFTLDRITSTFDGIPYTMQARNADMWLIEGSKAVHIHQLCSDQQNQQQEEEQSLPTHLSPVLNLTLSLCGQQMARLGAQAGRFQDRIATLNAASTLSPSQRFEKGDAIAASIDNDLLHLQNGFKLQSLPPQHNLLVNLGLARTRRDVSILLCQTLQSDSNDAMEWKLQARLFHRRRIDMARGLIQCALDHSGKIMLSMLGEPFFTNFICDAVMELANNVQSEWTQQGFKCFDIDFIDLKFAIMGRNLLVVIAKQSELMENHRLAEKACKLLSNVVNQVFIVSDETLLLSREVRDHTQIIAVDETSTLIQSSKGAADNTYPEAVEAKEWLDWISSYPALQQIFNIPCSVVDPTPSRTWTG